MYVYQHTESGAGYSLATAQSIPESLEFGEVARVSADGRVLAVSDKTGSGAVHTYDISWV